MAPQDLLYKSSVNCMYQDDLKQVQNSFYRLVNAPLLSPSLVEMSGLCIVMAQALVNEHNKLAFLASI